MIPILTTSLVDIGDVQLKEVDHSYRTTEYPRGWEHPVAARHVEKTWVLLTKEPMLLVYILWALGHIDVWRCASGRVYLQNKEQGEQAMRVLRRVQIG